MRGLIKLTAVANNIVARDWREIDKARHALEARITQTRSAEQQ